MPQSNIKIEKQQFDNAEFIPHVVDLLNEGHTVTLLLRGRSMRPYLEDGRDKGLIAKIRNPKKGDVVLAELQKGEYVLHRIIRIKGQDVTLRGDGNLGSEHCKIDDLKGFAIGFYRKGSTKLEKTNSSKWKIYSWLWTNAYPIRRYLLFAYRKINRLDN